MKLSEAFDIYINEKLKLEQCSKSNIKHYTYCRNNIAKVLRNKDIKNLKMEDVAYWMTDLSHGRCQNTIGKYIAELRQVLRYMLLRGEDVGVNPSLIPVPQRIPVTAQYVTPKEVQKIIDSTNNIRTKFVVSMLYASGVRVSELVSLNRGSVYRRQFTVIGKGHKERLCFIDHRTELLMRKYLQSRDDTSNALIVSNIYKERVSVSTIQMLIRNAVGKAGIKDKHITPHTFRHGHATNMIANGADIRYVARDLGHANLSTTMIYTHIEDPDMRQKYEKFHTI